MDKYLMMMFVTLEQEKAVKHMFLSRGWKYRKQDFSKTTAKVGPAAKKDPTTCTPTGQDCPTLTAGKKGRPRKSLSSGTDEPCAKKSKSSNDHKTIPEQSASAESTSASVQPSLSAKTSAKVKTSTSSKTSESVKSAPSVQSLVTVSSGSGNVSSSPAVNTSPRRSARTPKPNPFYVKEEAQETSKEEPLTLPLILSVESFAPSATTAALPTSVSTDIPHTQSASTVTIVFENLEEDNLEAPEFVQLDKVVAKEEASDPDYAPMSEAEFVDDDDDDDLMEEMDKSVVDDIENTASSSGAAGGENSSPEKASKPWYTATKLTFRLPSVAGLPDPREADTEDDAIAFQAANDAVEQLLKETKRKKRGKYRQFDQETKLKIGQHAVENGVMNTCRHFQGILGYSISESSVRAMRDVYLKKEVMRDKDAVSNLFLITRAKGENLQVLKLETQGNRDSSLNKQRKKKAS